MKITITFGRAKVDIHVRGCMMCGTEHSHGWFFRRKVLVQIGGRKAVLFAERLRRLQGCGGYRCTTGVGAMTDTIYLVLSRRGVERMYKAAKWKLYTGERVVRLNVEIPDSMFSPPPIPTLDLTLQPEEVSAPTVSINSDHIDGMTADENSRASYAIQKQYTQLLQTGLKSSDPAMRELASDAISKLIEMGVEVNINDGTEEQQTL